MDIFTIKKKTLKKQEKDVHLQKNNGKNTHISHSQKKGYLQMAKNRCSTSLITREMQIKTTKRDHLTSQNSHHKKKSTNSKCWRGCGKKGILLRCRWDCKLVQSLWKPLWLPWWLNRKESACNAEDLGSVPGLGRSLGEGNGNPLQYFCLEDPMDRGTWQATVHRVAESDTTKQLNFHFSFRYGEQCEGCLKS